MLEHDLSVGGLGHQFHERLCHQFVDDVTGRKAFGEAQRDLFLRGGGACCGGEQCRCENGSPVEGCDHEVLLRCWFSCLVSHLDRQPQDDLRPDHQNCNGDQMCHEMRKH